MADAPSRRAAAIGALELALLAAVAAGFLALYVLRFFGDTAAVMPHLWLLFNAWLATVAVRFLAWRWLSALAAPVVALVLVACTLLLATYYALVLLGLAMWGRVTTWSLIRSYGAQWDDLVRSLGLSPAAIGGGVVVLFLLLWWTYHRFLIRFDWPGIVARRSRSRTVDIAAFALLVIVGVQGFNFAQMPGTRTGEPLALTFFPEQSASPRQGNDRGVDPVLVETATSARASYLPGAPARTPNVILIVGDALRSDRMSLYGAPRRTTPFLDKVRASGRARVADPFRSICTESFCGLLAIASSQHLHRQTPHGLTLHEVLRLHGYQVHMILGGDHTNFYGLREAYGPVDSYYDGADAALYMNDDRLVLERVAALPPWSGRPQMIQFHLMSTHGLGTRHPEYRQFLPASNYYAKAFGSGDAPEAVQGARNHYDNGLLQFDAMVERLLGSLQQKGYLNDALVVITGDHGELLGEQGLFAHANAVFEPAMRVPLVFLHYGNATQTAFKPRTLASQVDIAPTILFEIGMPAPSNWEGIALQVDHPRTLAFFQHGTEAGILDGRNPDALWKYWVNLRDGREYAFELRSDPAEAINRIDRTQGALRGQWRVMALPATGAVVESANGDG